MGVFARVVAVDLTGAVGIAFPVLPFVGGRFTVVGEVERDAGGLDESVGVLNFLTDNGRRDDDGIAGSGIARGGFDFGGDTAFDPARSLCART